MSPTSREIFGQIAPCDPATAGRWWFGRLAWLDLELTCAPWAPDGPLWSTSSTLLNSAEWFEKPVVAPATQPWPRFLPPPLHPSVDETHARIVESAVK